MAELVLVLGKQGTGKTAAWRNVPENKTFIVKPNTKAVNIPDGGKRYSIDKNNTTGKPNLLVNNKIGELSNILKDISNNAPWVKFILIDDFTHFLSAHLASDEFINDTSSMGYGKWNKFGVKVLKFLVSTAENLRDDLIIVFNHHTEIKEDGSISIKTPGKMLDNAVDIPSYFNNIFHTHLVKEGNKTRYTFITNETGGKTAKTLFGLYDDEEYIDNDIYPILLHIAERVGITV